MELKNVLSLSLILLLLTLESGCAGVKVLSNAKSLKGKIVIAKPVQNKENKKLYGLYITNLDGSDLHLIPNSVMPAEILNPRFILNGEMILFYYWGSGNNLQEWEKDHGLYIMDVKKNKLNYFSKEASIVSYLLPNRRQIIYRDRSNNFFTINIDGTDKRESTESEKKYVTTDKMSLIYVSPDGHKKVWQNQQEHQWGADIYVSNIDDTEIKKLTDRNNRLCGYPVWSSDSQKIMYYYNAGREMPWFNVVQIRVINFDGTDDHAVIKLNPLYDAGTVTFDWWTPPVE